MLCGLLIVDWATVEATPLTRSCLSFFSTFFPQKQQAMRALDHALKERKRLEILEELIEALRSGWTPYTTRARFCIREAFKLDMPEMIRPLSREEVLDRINILRDLGFSKNEEFVQHLKNKGHHDEPHLTNGIGHSTAEVKVLFAEYLGFEVPSDFFQE